MSKNYKFVTRLFEDEISGTIVPIIFPKLNIADKKLICKYIVRLLNVIAIVYNFSNDESTYMFQLKQNNYQDIIWLISHLLPFLNNKKNELHNLVSLSEIYVRKKKDVNINLEEPHYVYSNIQYNRCERNNDNYIERKFNEEDLKHNFYILIDSIRISSNKLHVNWIDILPITYYDYQEKQIFKETKDKIKSGTIENWNPLVDASLDLNESKVCENLSNKIRGLDLYDIYNTMSYHLYEDIRQIKWLIYDIPLSRTILPIIYVLKIFFNVENNLKQLEWDDIKNTFFTKMWNGFINAAELGNNIIYKIYNINIISLRKLMKGIVFSFDKAMWSYTRKTAENAGYIPISQNAISNLMNDDLEHDEEDDLQFIAVLPSLKSFSAKMFYNFITESTQKFKGTWYATKLLNNDKTNIEKPSGIYCVHETIKITYKNVYNFAKSMVHHVETTVDEKEKKAKSYARYPENWKSLNENQKNDIIARLNNKYKNWFSILRYIKNLYRNSSINIKITDPIEINDLIHEKLMLKLPEIIFESMIFKGILTEFIPNSKKTNLSNTSRDKIYSLQKKIFDTSDDNIYWNHAYHYLTNIPYKCMGEFNIENKGNIIKHNHFTYNQTPDGGQWYAIYAYDWIAQIGFCHHFLNNRIIFITGATGVGKSTEIPKLFLYFSKSLEYIADPHLVCTEPRIVPTKKNAKYVAECLGVPMNDYVDKKFVHTNNYYIQTQYKEKESNSNNEVGQSISGSHYQNVSHASLKYITDGTLILEANNVILKDKYLIKNKENTSEQTYKFTNNNIYDIIMIDEAHEHKINMDLLLTMLKFGATYNNKIKLVIISATMDNDEAKYRRYFRDINDNRKYPLCTWIRDNKLDRINIDRRYHISPPSMGTRYKITEFYTPNVSEFDTVMNIVSKSESGHILVFEPGVKEIIKLVNELNKSLPGNVIAIPYHSKIEDDKKSFIDEINNKLKYYKRDRDVIFSDPSIKMNEIHIGTNTYTRAVIVATNIAEASITIINLKFVVDTGTQKIEPYDYKKRGTIIKKIFIAEENRLQRKGRAGRKEEGTVYYLYEKGSLENNSIDYEMSTKNIFIELLKKIKDKETERELILRDFDPNKPKIKLEINKIKEMYKDFGLDTTIIKQYFLSNEYYDYYGNDKMYDYVNYKNLHPFYVTGLCAESLIDNMGSFYLIHPDESLLRRNLVGDITGKKNNTNEIKFKKNKKYSGYIISKKIRSFLQLLLDNLYIGFNSDRSMIVKTLLGIEMIKLFETFQMDEVYYGLIRAVIFGMSIGCGEDMLKLCAFYITIKMSPLNINQDQTFNHGSDNYSDSKIILNYLKEFDKILEKIGLSTNIINNAIKLYSKIPEVKKYNLSRQDLITLLGPEDEHTQELTKNISSEEKKSKVIESIENFIIIELLNNMNKNTNEIQLWCNVTGLNFLVFQKYLYEYCKLHSVFYRKMNKETLNLIVNLKQSFSKTNIFVERNIDLVDVSLLFGYPCNVCKKVDDSMYYLSLYNPNLDNIYKIKSISQYKYKPNTLVNLSHLQNYILYFTIDINPETDEDTMTCLHKVEPKLITILAHIYNKNAFTKITSNTHIMDKIREIIDNKEIDKNTDLGKMIINYTKTLEQIENNLTNYSTNEAINVISNMDKSIEKIFEN